MRRLFCLLPLLMLLGCPNAQQVHLVTAAAPDVRIMRCVSDRMISLGYTVQDTAPSGFYRMRGASKREGSVETLLSARLFEYPETGVRRLSVRANQMTHLGEAPAQVQAVSRRARADAQAVIDACGAPREPS